MTNQPPPAGTRVRVWVNLHRQRAGHPDYWVIGTLGNKVIAYAESIALQDVTPKVSETMYGHIHGKYGGRRKVYARLEGTYIGADWTQTESPFLAVGAKSFQVHCNPHRTCHFTKPDGSRWQGSPAVLCPKGAGFLVAMGGAS